MRLTRLSPDLIATTLGLLLRAALQAAVFVIVARGLGPGEYGQFVALVSVGVLLVPCITAGHEFLALRALATRSDSPWAALRSGVFKTMVTAPPIIVVVAMACVHFLPGPLSLPVALSVLAADGLLVAWQELAWRVFQATEKMRIVALVRLLPPLTRLIAALLIVGTSAMSLRTWAAWYFVAGVVALGGSMWLLVREFGSPRIGVRASMGWRDGVPFAVHALTERATNDIDKVLLGVLDGARGAGLYGAAYRSVEMFVVPIGAVLMSANAQLFRAGHDGPRAVLKLVAALLGPVIAYGTLCMAILILAAPLLTLLLGVAYAETVTAVRMLAPFPVLFGLRSMLSVAVIAADMPGVGARIQAGAALVSVLGCAALIPEHGWKGAAVATLLVEAGTGFALYLTLHRAAVRQPIHRGHS